MKTHLFIISGLLLSGILFSASFVLFDEVVVASTGYNESEQGWFAWRSSYHNYEFIDDGNSVRSVLIDSGVTIHQSKLAAEIGLWLGVGFGVTALIWAVVYRGIAGKEDSRISTSEVDQPDVEKSSDSAEDLSAQRARR